MPALGENYQGCPGKYLPPRRARVACSKTKWLLGRKEVRCTIACSVSLDPMYCLISWETHVISLYTLLLSSRLQYCSRFGDCGWRFREYWEKKLWNDEENGDRTDSSLLREALLRKNRHRTIFLFRWRNYKPTSFTAEGFCCASGKTKKNALHGRRNKDRPSFRDGIQYANEVTPTIEKV